MKTNKIFRICLIIITLSIFFMGCSMEKGPSNYKKKSEKCDCSKWN